MDFCRTCFKILTRQCGQLLLEKILKIISQRKVTQRYVANSHIASARKLRLTNGDPIPLPRLHFTSRSDAGLTINHTFKVSTTLKLSNRN